MGGFAGAACVVAGVVFLVIAGWVVVSLGQAWRRAAASSLPIGVGLPKSAHPGLWFHIGRVASSTGVPAPEHVWLTAQPDVLVVDQGGERHLMLGLPVLVGATQAELLALLAHEFGHHRPGLAGRVVAGRPLLRAATRGLPTVLRPLGDVLARLYLAATAAWFRRREAAADHAAARQVGAAVVVASLRSLDKTRRAWAIVHRDWVPKLAATGQRAPLTTALEHVLLTYDAALSRPVPAVEGLRADPMLGEIEAWEAESRRHLGVQERIVLLGRDPSAPSGRDGSSPAYTLLGESVATLIAAEEQLGIVGDAALARSAMSTWPDVLSRLS